MQRPELAGMGTMAPAAAAASSQGGDALAEADADGVGSWFGSLGPAVLAAPLAVSEGVAVPADVHAARARAMHTMPARTV